MNKFGKKTLRLWPWLTCGVASWVAWRWISCAWGGFDFQDEGSYLLVSENPWRNSFSSLYGFVLHPLYLLSGQDPGWFRLLSVLVLLVGGWGLAWVWWRRAGTLPEHPFLRTGIAAVLISGALLVYSDGRRTPSYDTLVFFGALLAWGGYLGLWHGNSFRIWAWFALVNGILLAFLAKWPAGTLLVALFLLLIWKHRLAQRRDGIPVVGILSVVVLFWIWWVGWEGLQNTVQAVSLLAGKSVSHGAQLLPYYGLTLVNFGFRVVRAFAYAAPLLLLLWFLRQQKPTLFARLGAWAWTLPWLILAGGLIFGLTRAGASSFSRVGSNAVAEVLWLAGGCLLVVPWRDWTKAGFQKHEIFALGMTPFVLGVGTASALGDYVGHGVMFFQLAGLGVWLVLLRKGFAASFLTALLFLMTTLNLFRAEASLRNQFRTTSMEACVNAWKRPGGKTIYLDSDQVKLLAELRGRLHPMGFRPGDPIVAIGDMPGVVYFLGGYSPGTVWYPATRADHLPYVLALLDSVSAQMRQETFLIINGKSPLLQKKGEILDRVGSGPPFMTETYRLDHISQHYFVWPPVGPRQP